MFKLKTFKISNQILLLAIGSVLLTVVALTVAITWQSSQFNSLAQDQVNKLIDSDLGHIAEGVYNMVKAQDEAVQQQVNSSLRVAELVMHINGQVTLAEEKTDWLAVSESTQQSSLVQLPKLYVGDTWLGQNTQPYAVTPIVDQVQNLVGGTTTIFQRMNEQGDMLRVATNILLPNGQRAIGTFIPAVGPDNSPDPVISFILRGSVYRGSAFVVDAWYDTAYQPIRDQAGQVIGMLYVGVKQESVESIRQAILRTKVGQTGYVSVLGGQGNDLGKYIVSEQGQSDGENIWNTQDSQGNYVIQAIVNKALTLAPGETASERYLWQDPDEAAPRWKIARVAYYEPWHWVIVASAYEDDFGAHRLALQAGQASLVNVSAITGLGVALLVGLISLLLARSISRPITQLAQAAADVAGGNLNVSAKATRQDEIGTLARTFNSMTDQLRGMVVTLEDRVQARTDQLRASAEVGRAATSILDPDQLLEQVVNLIAARFAFYYAAVFTLDAPGKSALLRAATGEAGRTLLERRHHLPVNRESMVGTAIITQRYRIALVERVGEDAVRFANPLLPHTRSEIALPLRVGERVIGALDVQSEKTGAFDEANAEVLQTMADQIAVALFNAETFNRSEKQTHALAQLNQLSRELAQATTRESVAFAVAQAVIELIGPNRMALVEMTPNSQLLSACTLWPDANRSLGEPQPISASNSLSGDCLKRGELIYLPDLSTMVDKYEDAAVVYALGVQSSVAIPLSIGNRVIGTFNVASDQVNAYTAEQLSQLEQVAAQVALTLDGLNLAKQTQQALAELDAANRRLVGQVWSTYTHLGRLVAAEWHNGQWSTTRKQALHTEAAPSQALVSAAGAAFSPQAINLPIKVRGTTIGEFSVTSVQGQANWNSEEVAFAQALIDQVGQVLENARLLEETERSAQHEKDVADAAEKIHRSTDVETVLHSAITELNRITGQRGISIQLGFGQETRRQG